MSTNVTLLDKHITWLTKELASIDYSSDRQRAILYELGLLRAMLAECMYNDSHNVDIVKRKIRSNPYYNKDKE
jgi:hypothetical protein